MTTKRRSPLRALLFLVFILALVASACGDDDDAGTTTTAGGSDDTTADSGGLLGELQDAGTVTIGIANEVPYGYEDEDGNVTGEAPEVAKAVLAELGIDNVEAVVVDFGSLIPGLQAGQFDMIAAGMFITPERAEQVIFSDPDYCVGESFAVPEGNPLGLTDYPSIVTSGATVAVLGGAVNEDYVETAGVPEDQVTLFADVQAQYDALAAGRVDAVTGTFLTVKTQADQMDGFEATPSFFPLDSYPDGNEILGCGGFGFLDQDFRDAFNDVLHDLQDDGTVEEIVTSFGFGAADVQKAAELTVADLTGGSDDGGDDDGAEATGLLADLQAEGTVQVGLANEVPYGYEDEDGNVTGEAPEVAKAVLAELGIDNVEAVVVDFGSLIPGLQAGQFDMIAAGMFITPERAEQVIFSDPDYCVGESFAVPEGNPLGLTDYPSIVTSGATVAVLGGAVNEDYVETAGVPEDQVTLFADVQAQYDALAAGRVDAVTGTFLTVKTQADQMDGFEATPSFFPLDSYPDGNEILGCGGFGFLDQDFRDAFNDVLHDLQDDGTVEEIVTSFGFGAADVQKAAELTVADLTGG